MKKYRQPGETFYCLAWTTVTLDFGNGNMKRTNLIAAGGLQKDIKIIEPTQLVCFEEVKGHKGVLELLLFHPLQPTWLMSMYALQMVQIYSWIKLYFKLLSTHYLDDVT